MRSLLDRFVRDSHASVAVITAFAAIPMLFLIGAGVDYGMAVQREAELNGYADAAALAAVTPTMMAQSTSAATTAAQDTFNAQAASLGSITYSPTNLQVSISTVGAKRTATVSYSATYQTSFASILGMNGIALSGSSSATAGQAPNIDFYLLLDDSPSMAIAATQAGINAMVAATPAQGGCAFGCHETHPSSDNLGNPNGEDNYTLARNLGVLILLDASGSATDADPDGLSVHDHQRRAAATLAVTLEELGDRVAVYGFRSVNVESQERFEHSLLSWMKSLIQVRNSTRVFSRGTIQFLHPSNHRILAYIRQFNGETVLIVNNLSNSAQAVELDMQPYKGYVPIEMFGRNLFPRFGSVPYLLTLGPYQFYWFQLRRI